MVYSDIKWETYPSGTYCLYVELIEEKEGGYSAIVENLPGCGSCGQTKEEALVNVVEAFQGCIESYIECGKEIPWKMLPTTKGLTVVIVPPWE